MILFLDIKIIYHMQLEQEPEFENIAVRGDNTALLKADADKLIDPHDPKERAGWFMNAVKLLKAQNEGNLSFYVLQDIVFVLCKHLADRLGYGMDSSTIKDLIDAESFMDEEQVTSGSVVFMDVKLFDFEYVNNGENAQIMNFNKDDVIEALDRFENKMLFG